MKYKKGKLSILILLALCIFLPKEIAAKDCRISEEKLSAATDFNSITYRKWGGQPGVKYGSWYQFLGVSDKLVPSSNVRWSQDDGGTWVIDTASWNAHGPIQEVEFYLKDDITIDGCTSKKGSLVGTIEVYYQDGGDNLYYDQAICKDFREKYKKNKAAAKLAVPACYAKSATNLGSISSEAISAQIARFEKSVSNKPSDAVANAFAGEQNTSDVTKTGVQQCKYYTNEKNTVVKSHVEGKSENGCYRKCKEVVTVTFDPPIETQSGMCFSYVAEIKSTVDCVSEFMKAPPAEPVACYDQPECKHANGNIGQAAGPNSEFDSCITSCDNGAYSQKCIETCYNKVYKNKKKTNASQTRSLVSYSNNTTGNILRVDGTGEVTWDEKSCKIGYKGKTMYELNKVPYDDQALVQSLVQFKMKYPGGTVKNGRWVSGGKCSSDLSSFYFQDATQASSTLYMLNVNVPKYTPYQGALRKGECAADCTFATCDEDGENYQEKLSNYQQELETWKTEAQKCGLTTEEAVACLHDSTKCVSTSKVCNDQTGVYKVEVDETSSTNKTTTTKYEANQKQNSSQTTNNFWDKTEVSPNSIVKETSGICMGGTNVDGSKNCTMDTQKTQSSCTTDSQASGSGSSCTCYDYRDVITFPKNYINNKTGQPSAKPSLNEKYYTSVGNEYCTKLTTKSTNIDWYNWKVYGDGSEPTGEEKSKIEESTKNNIRISIEKFGYFGWSFDLNCFYALIRNPKNCKDGKCVEEGASEASVTSDFIARSIDLTNMFPVEESTGKSRGARYNWNCNGTNLENKDYVVQPEGLKDLIEQAGDSIYDESQEDKYLDYEIYLTPEILKDIRNYNDDQGSYYKPTYGSDLPKNGSSTADKKTYGVTVYKSPLIDELSGKSAGNKSVIKNRGLIGCNNQDGDSCNNKIYATGNGNSCVTEYKKGE